jgi:Cu-processing system permease protein
MRAIYEIAFNTFKETLRNHIVYLVLLFVVVLIVLSVSFGDWSVFARLQVIQDFGLATMSLSGLLVAVFIGVGMLGREISTKTLYHVITKPVTRDQFVLGKYAGLLAVVTLNFVVMTVFFLGTIIYLGGNIHLPLLQAVACIGVEMAVMISAALFFSSITSTVLAAMFSLAFYIAGHLNDLLSIDIASQAWSLFPAILKVLYYLLPNLEHFNIRDNVVYNLGIPHGYVALAASYGALYVVLFLMLTCIIFRRKDF